MNPSGILFMGEQEDPEMQVWLGRGLRVYDGTGSADVAMPAPKVGLPPGALYVHQDGRWVRCGCGRCFTGPCSVPLEDSP